MLNDMKILDTVVDSASTRDAFKRAGAILSDDATTVVLPDNCQAFCVRSIDNEINWVRIL